MRAAFKTWASDATEFPRELIEASLAHIVGDRADKPTSAAAGWSGGGG